jgi:hypothetical protein
MPSRPLATFALVVAASITAASCASDTPSAPQTRSATPAAPSRLLLGVLPSPINVTPLARTTPLASSITVSANIGVLGGRISVPGAGLSILIPAGAVTSTTKITVTAVAGSNVAYEFEPHGLHFVVPIFATQDLRNTQAASGGLVNPLSLFVGYFPDNTSLTSVTELLGLGIDLLNQTSTASISHFSGYIWATGCDSDE